MSKNTSPTQAKTGDELAINPHDDAPPMSSPDDGNSASALIEAPMKTGKGKNKLLRHDFADGGGSGGAEAFRRKQK